jgi:phage major head subunit gpT-like protein
MIKITLKGLNGVFSHELSRAPLGYVRSLAAMFSSNQSKEEYVGVGQAPSLELFKGEHHYSELGEDSFEVANKKWTTGISIPKETFLDDKTGDLRKRMADPGSPGPGPSRRTALRRPRERRDDEVQVLRRQEALRDGPQDA